MMVWRICGTQQETLCFRLSVWKLAEVAALSGQSGRMRDVTTQICVILSHREVKGSLMAPQTSSSLLNLVQSCKVVHQVRKDF